MSLHDKLFKRVFSVAEHAGREFESVLPAALVQALDLEALVLVPGSFVDPALGSRHTDLLFRAPRREDGGSVFVYLLLEHQSSPDPLMPWRILVYQQRIWAALLREEPGRTLLPPIVSVVVHHGAGGWTAPTRFHQLIEGLEDLPDLIRLVPDFEILVDDLGSLEDHVLAARTMQPLAKVSLWLLRDGRSLERFFESLRAWARELEGLVRDGTREDLEVVLSYILHVGGGTSYEAIRQRVVEVVPAVEEPMASAAEQLIQQGLEQGRRDTLRATVGRLLRARFGQLSPEVLARLDQADADTLDSWVEGVLTAQRAEDVFDP